MGAIVMSRNAGEMGSWKHENEWALALAMTRFEPRLQAVEVKVRDGARIHILVRYETAPGAGCTDEEVARLRRFAAGYANAWNAAMKNFERRARNSALGTAT